MKQEFKTSDIAEIFGLSNTAVINWIKAGKLTAYETGGGHYRVMRNDLIEFVKGTGKPLPKELESDKYRILVVDDEKCIHALVRRMLRDIGVPIEVDSAFNCFEAGLKINDFQPHLVVLDAIMPKCDGDVVVKLIRESEKLRNIKILVFTAYPGEGRKLVKLGADCAIGKGSDESYPDPFRKEVCRLLGVKYTKVLVTG